MLKHTKIVAIIPDQRCDAVFVEALYKTGTNVVRLNTAHMTEEGLTCVVNNVRTVSDRIGILVGTEGPEVHTTTMVNKESTPFKTGEIVKVTGNPDQETSHSCICMPYRNFVNDLAIGNDILVDDGNLEVKVTGKSGDCSFCEIQNDATLGSRKSMNVPSVCINLPPLIEKDRGNILWAVDHDPNFITHSSVRDRQDVLDIQRILDERSSSTKIIAKIENQEGVGNIEEILGVTYGVTVTRGNLGVEVLAEKIPGIQRMLIRKCAGVKKPVIVATQMLYSMTNNPRPARAEATDIANAIYYRTDASMLSGETAYGKYPVEAVQIMTKVAREAEKTKFSVNDIRMPIERNDLDVTSFLAEQAVKSSSKLHAKAIITDSYTGRTVRYLAAFCGASTVFAIRYNPRVMHMLGLSYGIWVIHQPYNGSHRGYFYDTLNQLIHSGRITHNDMVAYLSGGSDEGGGTSFLEINNVGKVLDADT